MNKITTPIADFVYRYAERQSHRFHMPGHKGTPYLGAEPFDITEINGADVLYHASGIIAESEENATRLFKTAHSFYSTEGSTLAIKAMLSLVRTAAKRERVTVLAARNVHKAFVYAAAWLDLDVKWLMPAENSHLCACLVTKEAVKKALSESESEVSAVYLTSPDYLGNLCDVKGIAEVCRDAGIPLLVDNAHGAYLAFHQDNLHPIALGATMTADSAHKTLPVLTGGAYLHIAKDADPYFVKNARAALSSFASTSPSYLTLASLDLCNRYLADGYFEKYAACLDALDKVRALLTERGFVLLSGEPLKLVFDCAAIGSTGDALADYLRENRVECEFSDDDYLVLMVTPENSVGEICYLAKILEVFPILPPRDRVSLPLPTCDCAMSIRSAMLSRSEEISVKDAFGRIAASPTVSCPPAIPIVVSGEVITEEAIALFEHYGIDTVSVITE